MIFAPHTLELTLNCSSEKFGKLRNAAYENAKGKHKMFMDGKKVVDRAMAKEGVKIEYHDDVYKKIIKFIVNPTTLLGGNDVKKLWRPNDDNTSKMVKKLENSIADYFNSKDDYFSPKYKLNDFRLTRIDFTVNVNVGDNKTVAAYIKVLRNIGKVKGFAPKYSKTDERIDPERSFDLKGNSNNHEFAAYDKQAQSDKKEAKGILRIEVRLMKPKAIANYVDDSLSTKKKLRFLSANSKEIFLITFRRIVPQGDYYTKKGAENIIIEQVTAKKHREKMLKLLNLIPKKKSLYLAQKEMKDRGVEKVMAQFAEINLSPVVISKRGGVRFLKSLYCCIT